MSAVDHTQKAVCGGHAKPDEIKCALFLYPSLPGCPDGTMDIGKNAVENRLDIILFKVDACITNKRACDGVTQILVGFGFVQHISNVGCGASDAVIEGGRDLNPIAHDDFEALLQGSAYRRCCRKRIRYNPCGAVLSRNRPAPAPASRGRRCA